MVELLRCSTNIFRYGTLQPDLISPADSKMAVTVMVGSLASTNVLLKY